MANKYDRNILKGESVTVKGREFIVSGGFGLMASTNGTAIFGKWKDTGEDDRISGMDID